VLAVLGAAPDFLPSRLVFVVGMLLFMGQPKLFGLLDEGRFILRRKVPRKYKI
jgi:hypothetical protein